MRIVLFLWKKIEAKRKQNRVFFINVSVFDKKKKLSKYVFVLSFVKLKQKKNFFWTVMCTLSSLGSSNYCLKPGFTRMSIKIAFLIKMPNLNNTKSSILWFFYNTTSTEHVTRKERQTQIRRNSNFYDSELFFIPLWKDKIIFPDLRYLTN